ncbi:MAG: hypothetical protein RIC16_04430 [Rhodospirillales bacterium]
MNMSQRIGAIALIGLFIATILSAHVAYGYLAAVAVFAVLVCPLVVGLVYCLPDSDGAGAPGRPAAPLMGHGVVRP